MKLIYISLFYFSLSAFQQFESNSALPMLPTRLPGLVFVRQASKPKTNPVFNKLLLTGLSMTGDLTKLGVDQAIVKSALLAKADPNLRINGAYGAVNRPMHYAAMNGKIKVAEILLQHKSDPMPVDAGDNTPLHVSIANRRTEFTEFLTKYLAKFKQGPQVNPVLEMLEKHEKWSPLHMACWFNDNDACRLLLQAGARPDAKLNFCGLLSLREQDGSASCHRLYRKSPLHIAAVNGNSELIQMLLDAGATKDLICTSWGTPLHIAVKNSDSKIVQQLLANGVQLDLPDAAGRTPLECANDAEIKMLLTKHEVARQN
jgi:hypothetical protein